MEAQDRSRSPSRRTSRVEQVVGRWLRRSRDLGSRSHSLGRDRVAADGKPAESGGSDQRNYSFRFNVQIQRDAELDSHGLALSSQTPIVVQEVTPGGPADGRLVPGDQLVKINNVAVDDLTPEQASEIIRECQDTLTMTVLRTMVGPKSSFITPEKRAKLRSNPVKVRFAEEVEVNGHSQGNSLLFLPNVLKVYLENGQTKAFKFEPSTTVKDIVMTLKEKLSLSRIEHFSLVLEQQHSISKLLLLHDEERIQQVVQKKEAHDYRCLFRVCFMPRDLQTLLHDDATAFEYLYLQGVNDVLQERFAVEMRCNTALRLAALHIQERLASCGQSSKANLKMITKTWGIENFVSSTLLRNMREKDLRKAIGYHMKKSQSLHDPKQRGVSIQQARVNYLEELSDLKSFGGKSFGATMMLQDRESMVTLLVGARYGVSQVVNHKLSILSTLTEFSSITRIELLPESDKVSLVKIYLQDIKPITLLLESAAAKDMSCLIAGYCRVFVDPNLNIFPWIDDSKKHRVSAEEGYVSRCGSDSDDSSDSGKEAPLHLASRDQRPRPRVRSSSDPDGRKRKDRQRNRDGKEASGRSLEDGKLRDETDGDAGKEKSPRDEKGQSGDAEEKKKTEEARDCGRVEIQITETASGGRVGGEGGGGRVEEQPSVSEASDSCHTDSRVLTSPSCDSLDALEEDDLLSCSSASVHHPSLTHAHSSLLLHPYPHRPAQPHLLTPPPPHSHPLLHLSAQDGGGGGGCRRSGDGADPPLVSPASASSRAVPAGHPGSDDGSLCFAELSRLVDFLPSPPEASEEEDEEDELRRRRMKLLQETEEEAAAAAAAGLTGDVGGGGRDGDSPTAPPSPSPNLDSVFNFEQSDARCYYNICSNITPDSARSLAAQPAPGERAEAEAEAEAEAGGGGGGAGAEDQEPVPILQPPPGFGDSSSDEEFFDAQDRFASPEDPTSGGAPRDVCTEMKLNFLSTLSLSDIQVSVADGDKDGQARVDGREDGDETLFQLRKRSRKRRSYMETDYTSRVSYPEPGPRRDPAPVGPRRDPLAEAGDAQVLSSDPEPSEQSQNPSPTVSSLTHSEGEPAQLESKPIRSKLRSRGPEPPVPAAARARESARDPNKSSPRAKKQEMEMEPDAMESKSVTDLLKPVSPPITVVRYRVDPDGKESADRRGDGKEEGGNDEAAAGVTGNGPFATHMFLPLSDKEEEERRRRRAGHSPGLQGAPVGAASTCLPEVSNKGSNGILVSQLIEPELKTNIDEYILENEESKPSSCSPPPPPPPPSSPLPPPPVVPTSQSDRVLKDEGSGRDARTSCSEDRTEARNHTDRAQPAETGADGSAATTSDEVTDSTNSDNVFDDEDADAVSNSSSFGSRDDGTKRSDSRTSVEPPPNAEPHAPLRSVSSDYARTIDSITAKLGAATSVTSPTFGSAAGPKGELDEKPPGDSAVGGGSAGPSPAKLRTAAVQEPPPPAHFLFQTCSPSIMGRLSASTLRGKIQKLPLYLSRSQETVNQAGVETEAQSPSDGDGGDGGDGAKITIKVTDEHDVTVDLEAVESDDSDSTVTGSDVDGESLVEVTRREEDPPPPVRTEPKPQHRDPLHSGPGPITEPPTPAVSHLQTETAGPRTDAPGPVKDAPEPNRKVWTADGDAPGYKTGCQSPSRPGPIVLTTRSLNGPGLPFQPQKARRTSSDRPLMALCRPSERNSLSPKTAPSSGCRVFTICEGPSLGGAPGEAAPAPGPAPPPPPLKAELGCGSALASGCESVAEGIQAPLDACGCPAVYANCFSGGVDGFDDELTVYEFSCRTQSGGATSMPAAAAAAAAASGAGLPLVTSAPVPSFLSTTSSSSSAYSPSFPRSILFSSSTSELSPLLSPLSDSSDSFVSQTHRDAVGRLGRQRYPEPPAGFQLLRVDVDQLLAVLEGGGGGGGRHPRDTCPAHFAENKRVLQLEARRLTSGCQKAVGIGQSPEQMLRSLADSFRTLVELAGVCLWFSGCERCDRRNAEAVAGLADVARSFRDFCLAAERASGKRGCQDLSTKLLAKQCTALTASVFCLTQLFRTLTAL